MASANQRVGEYVLQDRIAAGTFGEVWRAHHHVWTDRLVAVKVPTDPQYLRNLQREGFAIHGLTHANIVRAIGFDPYADPPYLMMEYIPGTSLRPLVQQRAVGVNDAVAVMRQVLSGLAHAHQQGVIHRDIKPENILVHERAKSAGYGAEGVIKLTDFGLGKAAAATAAGSIAYSQSMNTPAGAEIAGTLDYMAPEARAGAPDVGPRADLYACGVVLYELLTGERPAGTDLPSDLNPAVPKTLDQAFRRSYARLDKRFASAEEFLAALPPPMPASGKPPPLPPGGGRAAGYRMVAVAALASELGVDARQMLDAFRAHGHDVTSDVVTGMLTFEQAQLAREWAGTGELKRRRSGGGDVPPPPLHRTSCPQCRQSVDPADQFCMHCGVQLVENVRRCPQCGAYPDAADQFCIFCGQSLTMTAQGAKL